MRTLEQIAAKFWANVDTSAGAFECWPWLQSRDLRGGYGQLHTWPKVLKAHRVAYELGHGAIPEGAQVRHTCDNPPCCNPAHLSIGTSQDNHDDMVRRGRALVGSRNPAYRPDADRWPCGHVKRPGRRVCARHSSGLRRAMERPNGLAKDLTGEAKVA